MKTKIRALWRDCSGYSESSLGLAKSLCGSMHDNEITRLPKSAILWWNSFAEGKHEYWETQKKDFMLLHVPQVKIDDIDLSVHIWSDESMQICSSGRYGFRGMLTGKRLHLTLPFFLSLNSELDWGKTEKKHWMHSFRKPLYFSDMKEKGVAYGTSLVELINLTFDKGAELDIHKMYVVTNGGLQTFPLLQQKEEFIEPCVRHILKEEGFAEDVLDDVMDLSHPKTSELFRYGGCISPLINGEISAEEFISFAENEISSLWEEFVAESSLGLAAEQCQKRIVLFFDTKQGFLWQFSPYGNPLGFPLSVPSEAQANAFILWLKLQPFPILMRWEYA